MSQRRLPWLICYDVRCPRRLARLHRRLCKRAAPVQYSVFLGYWTDDEVEALLDELYDGQLEAVDDLRAYPVADGNSVTLIGHPRCPEGWSGLSRLMIMAGSEGDTSRPSRGTRQTTRQNIDSKKVSPPEQPEPMP